MTPSTLFYGASTSKAFTAAALSMMIQSGNYTVPALPGATNTARLAWDTPVHDIIPGDFVLADAWATTHVTLEDALSHRTGLPRHDKASTHRVVDDGGNDGSRGRLRTATVRDGVRAREYQSDSQIILSPPIQMFPFESRDTFAPGATDKAVLLETMSPTTPISSV